jgi:hypothetical protein
VAAIDSVAACCVRAHARARPPCARARSPRARLPTYFAQFVITVIIIWLIASFICGFDFSKCGAGAKK